MSQCNATSIGRILRAYPDTSLIAVRLFKQGEILSLVPKRRGSRAAQDLCMLKLNVGPGNPGPAGAPSTSAGIGIEIWLPARWRGRIHEFGGGGFDGEGAVRAKDRLANWAPWSTAAEGFLAEVAQSEGSIAATADGGHSDDSPLAGYSGAFLVDPDGGINKALWKDFAERSIHEMTRRAKAIAAGYYGRKAGYSYFQGCSGGGREALREAQEYPGDFNGILAGSPAINWSRGLTADLYPQLVMQRDLSPALLTAGQLKLVSAAAVSACDSSLTGKHLGYITDPAACRYDPAADRKVLCRAGGGDNDTADCVDRKQALAIDKMWYGQTADGTAPKPSADNGFHDMLGRHQLWYGITRGTDLADGQPQDTVANVANGLPEPFPIAADQVALELQNLAIAASSWRNLGYADLARAQERGVALQPEFSRINSDDPNLQRFEADGGKLIEYNGMADQLIPTAGANNYYARVAGRMGGYKVVRTFYRYYPIPGMGHCGGIGSVAGLKGVSPPADPPLPGRSQLFEVLVDWVEMGKAPEGIVIRSSRGDIAHPLCALPAKLIYTGGETRSASSYRCE